MWWVHWLQCQSHHQLKADAEVPYRTTVVVEPEPGLSTDDVGAGVAVVIHLHLEPPPMVLAQNLKCRNFMQNYNYSILCEGYPHTPWEYTNKVAKVVVKMTDLLSTVNITYASSAYRTAFSPTSVYVWVEVVKSQFTISLIWTKSHENYVSQSCHNSHFNWAVNLIAPSMCVCVCVCVVWLASSFQHFWSHKQKRLY